MDSKQKELYKKVDEILWNDWDPIGVNDSVTVGMPNRRFLPFRFGISFPLMGCGIYLPSRIVLQNSSSVIIQL